MNSLSCPSVLALVTAPRALRAFHALTRGTRPLVMAMAAACAGTLTVAFAFDAPEARADDAQTSPAARDEAQAHFKKARELYAAGSYHEAASELDAARALDPHAKDLVFNHGVVMERLGHFDDALTDFHQYEAMDLTPAERSRAEATIRRVEGAKREADPNATPLATAPTATAAPTATTPPTTTPAPPSTASVPSSETSTAPAAASASSSNGRMDGATIATGAVGVAGLAVGTVFGVIALGKNPKSYVTGSGHSYNDYLDAKSAASTDATISTVGFGVGIAGLAVATILYFARSSDAPADRVAIRAGKNGAILGGTF